LVVVTRRKPRALVERRRPRRLPTGRRTRKHSRLPTCRPSITPALGLCSGSTELPCLEPATCGRSLRMPDSHDAEPTTGAKMHAHSLRLPTDARPRTARVSVEYTMSSDGMEERVRSLLEQGEGSTVEYKSSLRYDYRTEAVNKDLTKVVAKTIAAFLNSQGG